ncbi:TetR/AcrR family transcriptional regulator [Cryptosporangium sp. NPDC051539]|uniref:TetR/AcrR family transcriptional regulator n=1 Tax=Cryptosporangium sp. NPDC051539 TaxID=3363962 RepID=UPI0037BA9116
MTSVPESPAVPRRRPRDRKQQILVAARGLFVERGYPNVSMALLAERLGITAGALYRHFDNKAVLLEHVVDDSFEWLSHPVTETDFDRAVAEAITRVGDHPNLSDLWIHEIRYLPAARRAELNRRMTAWVHSVRPAVASRRPDLDAGQQELLVWAFQSAFSCLGRRAIHAPAASRVPAVTAAIRAMVDAPLEPTGRPQQPRPATFAPVSRRERLLQAALEQFGLHGYEETSMTSVGAAADVTGQNLYSYFDSKADLLRAVYDRGRHALWFGLDHALEDARTPHEALVAVVRSYARIARSWSMVFEDPTAELTVTEDALNSQREYVAEWVALLNLARPDIPPRQARLRVQMSILLIADLYRNRRVSLDRAFPANVEVLVEAILFE